MGYLTKKTENGKVLTYTYDLYGKVLSMTDQLGMTTAYEYNEKNQITKVTADGKEFTYSYYPNGLVQSLTYPASKNGTKVATNYTYDNAGRLTNVSTPVLNESYSYSYDENSNINGVNNNVEFFYDEVNRIAMSNFKSVGNTQNLYSYDGRGNIKNHVSNKTLPSPKPYTYTYDASNRVKEVRNGSTAVASYDYDMDGIRNKKTVNGSTTDYYTANGNVIAEKTGSSERHNVWTDRILARKDGATWYYLVYDGLNDVRKVITDSANVVANYAYDEWGNILEKSGSYADQNPIRYKGEYFDDETGFIYLRARYYDPTVGRFIGEDKYWNESNMIYGDKEFEQGEMRIPDLNTILQSRNMYTYSVNNPIMYSDLSGFVAYEHFATPLEAAIDWAWNYFSITDYIYMEVSSVIYMDYDENDNKYYSYAYSSVAGGAAGGDFHTIGLLDSVPFVPEGAVIVYSIHSHPSGCNFSVADEKFVKSNYKNLFLVGKNSNGSLDIRVIKDSREGIIKPDDPIATNIPYAPLTQERKKKLRNQFEFLWQIHLIDCTSTMNCKNLTWPNE